MTFFLIFGIVILIISLVVVANDTKIKTSTLVAYIVSLLGTYLISGVLMWLDIHKQPTAMDVYQGKTTLEITYKDGMAVDSVVVFKNK